MLALLGTRPRMATSFALSTAYAFVLCGSAPYVESGRAVCAHAGGPAGCTLHGCVRVRVYVCVRVPVWAGEVHLELLHSTPQQRRCDEHVGGIELLAAHRTEDHVDSPKKYDSWFDTRFADCCTTCYGWHGHLSSIASIVAWAPCGPPRTASACTPTITLCSADRQTGGDERAGRPGTSRCM